MTHNAGKTGEDTLERLARASREKQAAFIGNIARRLGRPPLREKPAHPFKGAPSYWSGFELPTDERIALFSDNWRKAGGHVVHLATMEEARRWIAEKATELGAKRMLRQNEPELDAMALETALPDVELRRWTDVPRGERLATAAGADIGLVLADYAVAYTGSIVAMSSERKGRSVSLLPTALFAIVPTDRLRTRLGEVLREVDATPREALPAGIHFISGPSRSADIENDLTIGVHGPGVVFAIVVG